jgi:hypothetical protein
MFAPKRQSAVYTPMFATPAALPGAPSEDGGGGPFGFLGNIAGEAKDIVTGLGTLVGTGIHDVGRGLGQVLPGRQDWGIISDNPADEYRLDQVAAEFLPAVIEDLGARYGPLARGDIGGFAEQVYERPLSFGLDVLAVGQGLSKGAQYARRAGVTSSALDRFLPQETARLVGTEVQRGLRTGNPVRAALFERPFERFGTRPISELEADVGALQALEEAGLNLPAQSAELARLSDQLRVATEAGVERIYKPALENRLLRKMTDRLIGAHFQAGLKARDEDLLAVQETLEPLAAEGITDDVAEAAFQRLSIEPGLRAIPEGEPGRVSTIEALTPEPGPLPAARVLDPADELDLRESEAFYAQKLDELETTRAEHFDASAAAYGERGSWPSSSEMRIRADEQAVEAMEARLADVRGQLAEAAPGNITSTSAGEIGTASRLSSEAANRGLASSQPLSGLQTSSAPSGASSSVRSRSPLAFQYLGPEATISRTHAPFHGYSNTQALLDAAPGAETELRQVLDQVYGPEALGPSRVKSADSLQRKLEHKALLARIADGVDVPPESFLPSVTDGVGARVEIGSWSEVASKLDQLRQNGVEILEVDDFVASPQRSGYRGVHATVRLPSGFVGEVQFHTPLSARMAHAGHPSYEVLRDLEKQVLELRSAGEDIPLDLQRQFDLTETYVRRFQEPVLREMEEQLRRRPMSTLDRTMEDMRLIVQERLTNPMIERGLLTPAEAMERAYLPLRVADGASYDYKAGGFVGGRDVLELDQLLDAQGISAPIYFPHVDVRKVNFSDFISLSKQRIGARRMTRLQYAERNTGYLLEKGLYNKSPLEAYSRRAAQAVRFEETYRFVNDIAGRFGRRISSVDDINPATEMVFAPDGLLRFFRQQMHVRDAAADVIAAARSEDEHLAAALRSVLEPVQDEIGDVVTRQGVGVTKRGIELYAIPKAVAERLEAHVRPLLGPTIERNLRLFWDTPTNAWRGFVLAGSPRWLVNNTLGNVVFAKMQGARLRDVIAQLDKRYLAKMREIPGITGVEGGMFGQSSMYLAKRGSANLTKTGQLLEAGAELGAVRKVKAVGERVRQINGVIEDAFRRASYLRGVERAQLRSSLRSAGGHFESGMKRLETIAKRGFDDNTARQGLDEVNYFFNDYSAATPFGRQIIRRFVAPFWSFYRHVAKLAVTWPVDYPLRAEVLKGLTLVTNDMVEEYGPLPPWLEGALPLGPGMDGAVQFLSTRGANPFNTLFQAPLSLLHPLWKMTYEQSTGRSSFTGRPFTSPDVITPFGSDQQFQIIRDDLGRPIDAVPIERVTPSLAEQLLQNFPQYELAKDIAAGGAAYSTADLLDILAGEGVIRDEFGNPLFPTSAAQKAAAFAGAPVFETDLAEYQAQLEEERQQAIATALSRMGAS